MNCAAEKAIEVIEAENNPPPEFLIIGVDLTEIDAIKLRIPIRIAVNGEKFIWLDDLNPE